jgi:hypothetical protein
MQKVLQETFNDESYGGRRPFGEIGCPGNEGKLASLVRVNEYYTVDIEQYRRSTCEIFEYMQKESPVWSSDAFEWLSSRKLLIHTQVTDNPDAVEKWSGTEGNLGAYKKSPLTTLNDRIADSKKAPRTLWNGEMRYEEQAPYMRVLESDKKGHMYTRLPAADGEARPDGVQLRSEDFRVKESARTESHIVRLYLAHGPKFAKTIQYYHFNVERGRFAVEGEVTDGLAFMARTTAHEIGHYMGEMYNPFESAGRHDSPLPFFTNAEELHNIGAILIPEEHVQSLKEFVRPGQHPGVVLV